VYAKIHTADEYDRYLSTPPEPSITGAFAFWQSQHQIYPYLSALALDIVSIPTMLSGVERLFSECKIMLTDRRNRLQIESLQAVDYMKSWDRLQIGILYLLISGEQLEDTGRDMQQDGNKNLDRDTDMEMELESV
jgi:hypothetical protein